MARGANQKNKLPSRSCRRVRSSPALWAAAVFGAGLLAFRKLRPGILRRL